MKTLYGVGGVAVLVIVLALVFWFYNRGVKGVAKDTASGLVDAASGTFEGVVSGVSSTVGIPDTDPAKCAADLGAGSLWDASFSCAALTFFKGVFNKTFSIEPLKGTTQ